MTHLRPAHRTAAVAAAYLLVDSVAGLVAVAVCDALLASGNLVARAALVATAAARARVSGSGRARWP